MNLKEYLDLRREIIDKALDKYLKPRKNVPEVLIKAMRYSIFAGGKRIRPILCLCAGEIIGAKTRIIVPIACALELIHTYSLIHDDLPALDNDDYRRGKLSNHKVFGEDIAIGAGDCLLTYAFEIISTGYSNLKIKPVVVLKLIKEVSSAAGLTGMIAGQIADLEFTRKKADKKNWNISMFIKPRR